MKINKGLKESYKLDEASLTPEEKMDAWFNGARKENIKACGDSKLQKYLEICKDKGYLEQAKQISDELKNRGISSNNEEEEIIIYGSNHKPIYRTYDRDDALDFFLTHATAIECSDSSVISHELYDSSEKDYLEFTIKDGNLILKDDFFAVGLLNNIPNIDTLHDYENNVYVIPKDNPYINKISQNILNVVKKESRDYNI